MRKSEAQAEGKAKTFFLKINVLERSYKSPILVPQKR